MIVVGGGVLRPRVELLERRFDVRESFVLKEGDEGRTLASQRGTSTTESHGNEKGEPKNKAEDPDKLVEGYSLRKTNVLITPKKKELT